MLSGWKAGGQERDCSPGLGRSKVISYILVATGEDSTWVKLFNSGIARFASVSLFR